RGAGAALVFEAGRLSDQIVVERKGTGKARVIARGKAAHAGNDLAAGVNAIWALARFIDQAQRETDAATGVTVNVGLVHGGARAEGLRDGEAPLQGGGSDGNTVSAVGVPAIDALGPRGRGFHTHDEHVEVSTFAQRTRALVRFLVEW